MIDRLPSAAARQDMHAELAHTVADDLARARVPFARPRPAQVFKALGLLLANLDLWEADGRAGTLDMYLAGRIPDDYNPLRNLRQYRQFGDIVGDAAAVLMIGGQ